MNFIYPFTHWWNLHFSQLLNITNKATMTICTSRLLCVCVAYIGFLWKILNEIFGQTNTSMIMSTVNKDSSLAYLVSDYADNLLACYPELIWAYSEMNQREIPGWRRRCHLAGVVRVEEIRQELVLPWQETVINCVRRFC